MSFFLIQCEMSSFSCQLISQAGKVIFKILQTRLQQEAYEPRTSRCISWIEKRQRNQRSNCQHPLDHRENKGISEKHLLH